MNDLLHVLCAMNPTAGSGTALRRWPEIEALLKVFDMTWDLVAAPDVSLGEQVVRRLETAEQNRPYQAVVGIGGDGTHSLLINTLMNYRHRTSDASLPPYALIPMGTGNNMAKSFGLNSREDFFVGDLRQAVATIRYGANYALDLGCVGEVYFVNSLTVGLDSKILREHNRRKQILAPYPWLRRWIRGNLLYTWCLGHQFWRHPSRQATIQVDGRPWYEGPLLNLVIMNSRVYAGEFVLCVDAYANDGRLNAVVFVNRTDYIKKYLLALRRNPRQIQSIPHRLGRLADYTQGQRITVTLPEAEAAQYDGEVLADSTYFEVAVIPQAIQIKVPAERA